MMSSDETDGIRRAALRLDYYTGNPPLAQRKRAFLSTNSVLARLGPSKKTSRAKMREKPLAVCQTCCRKNRRNPKEDDQAFFFSFCSMSTTSLPP